MSRIIIFILSCLASVHVWAQGEANTLAHYLEAAKQNSPLLADYRNQQAMEQAELARLKALYTHSRLEAQGELLFVPIVETGDGHTAFKWNAQGGTDYYGYDLGETSGHLHAGVTWTQPLLGGADYRVAQAQARVNTDMATERMHLEAHRLERVVTEQYVLCLLDRAQKAVADTMISLLDRQAAALARLARAGLAKQSDLHLLAIERTANEELRTASLQAYHAHLMDLNLLCGIADTADAVLADEQVVPQMLQTMNGASRLTEQFRLDSVATTLSLRSFELQYRPRLNLFVDGGVQSGVYQDAWRHFGVSAGLTFSWTLADGKQRRYKARQASLRQATTQAYRANAELQRRTRVAQAVAEMSRYDERERTLKRQGEEYENVLANYGKEMAAGQVSVIDYLTVLRQKVEAEKALLAVRANRQIAAAAYNYWNW